MRPLLCELHAHTTWSDGMLSLRELVDLYGGHAFDVLCVTDHALAPGDPYPDPCVTEGRFPAYLDEIGREAERARARYGLVLVAGLELTFNDVEPDRAAHALTLGLELPVPLEDWVAQAMTAARAAGAAVIAAHPSGPGPFDQRTTRRFWTELDELAPLDLAAVPEGRAGGGQLPALRRARLPRAVRARRARCRLSEAKRPDYGFKRQPDEQSAVAIAKATTATRPDTASDTATFVSWKPVNPARAASTT
jgi:hypothetical protein